MSIKIHILSATKDLKPFKTALTSVTKSAERAIRKLVPLGNIDVIFYNNPEGTIKELGIGGYTPAANIIFISLDPKHHKIKQRLKEELFYTLVHEINHGIRFRTPIPQDTLLEAMISEGLADHFAMQVSGRKTPPPWCTALNALQKKTFLKKAATTWNLPVYDHAAWFYGTNVKKIPRWAAYTLGYDLVASYLQEHPKIKVSQLIAAKATLFV